MPEVAIYEHLFNQMKSLDYDPNPNGSCLGFAKVGRQAIHLRKVGQLKKRLEFLTNLPVDALKGVIMASRKISKNSSNLAIEIPPFFESMLIYQLPANYSHLSEHSKILQDDSNVNSLLLSKELEEKMGFVKSEAFSGVYNCNEMEIYLDDLADACTKANPQITQPISLIFVSGNHAMALGFDPLSQNWSFIELSQFPSEWERTNRRIAQKVIEAFSKGCGLRRREVNPNKEDLKNFFYIRSQYMITDTDLFYFCHREKTLEKITCTLDSLKTIDRFLSEIESDTIEVLAPNQLDTIVCLTKHSIAEYECCALRTELSACKEDELGFINAINAWKSSINWQTIHAVTEKKAQIIDSNKVTWLHQAVFTGQLSLVSHLLKCKSEINCSIPHNIDLDLTPLKIAVMNGDLDIVELFLKNGAEFEDWSGKTPLYYALTGNHIEIVKLLLNRNPSLTHIIHNYLAIAIQSKNLEAVYLLLHKGAPINTYGKIGQNYLVPLLEAIKIKNISLIQDLIDRNADVNQMDANGIITPLLQALHQENFDVARLLLHNGADINLANKVGLRAIDFAISYNHLEIVSFLLDANQLVDLAPNNKGINPMDRAIENKNLLIIDRLLLKNVVVSQENQLKIDCLRVKKNNNYFFSNSPIKDEAIDYSSIEPGYYS